MSKTRDLDARQLPEIPDDDTDFTPELARKIIAKYQDLVVALSAPRVGPVAWQCRVTAGNDWIFVHDTSDENLYALDKGGWETRPLYAHPAPPDTGWQPIETAPKDGTWVLVWEQYINTKYHAAEVARFLRDRWVNSASKHVPNVAHWMPLPAPPDAGDRG